MSREPLDQPLINGISRDSTPPTYLHKVGVVVVDFMATTTTPSSAVRKFLYARKDSNNEVLGLCDSMFSYFL